MTFDWRKEYERQHGHKPAVAARITVRNRRGQRITYEKLIPQPVTEAPTATAGLGHQPAPAKASEMPAAEATAGGEVENPANPGASASPDFERVEVAPNRFVNLSAARQLGLVK